MDSRPVTVSESYDADWNIAEPGDTLAIRSDTMARKWNPFILIPIILDIGVLAIFPTFVAREGLARALPVSLIAMAFPWLLFFIIGSGISSIVEKEKEKQEEEHKRDFV
jgi:hypothetical protein